MVFPRIAIKSSPGALIAKRETEKVLDEKITTRTEEVSCPLTGVPHLRTVEVVEKLIETEVVLLLKMDTLFSLATHMNSVHRIFSSFFFFCLFSTFILFSLYPLCI